MSRKRDEARAKAAAEREARKTKEKRHRLYWQVGGILGGLALVALTILVLSMPKPVVASPESPRNMATGGLAMTNGSPIATAALNESDDIVVPEIDPAVPRVVIYADYLCEYCKQFEETFAPYLNQLADSGAIILEHRPVAILDNQKDGYSLRTANFMSCIADTQPSAFPRVHDAIFKEQDNAPLDNKQLIELGEQSGLIVTDELETCTKKGTFDKWVMGFTGVVVNDPELANPETGSFGTPTITINGERFNSGDLVAAIDEARQPVVD